MRAATRPGPLIRAMPARDPESPVDQFVDGLVMGIQSVARSMERDWRDPVVLAAFVVSASSAAAKSWKIADLRPGTERATAFMACAGLARHPAYQALASDAYRDATSRLATDVARMEPFWNLLHRGPWLQPVDRGGVLDDVIQRVTWSSSNAWPSSIDLSAIPESLEIGVVQLHADRLERIYVMDGARLTVVHLQTEGPNGARSAKVDARGISARRAAAADAIMSASSPLAHAAGHPVNAVIQSIRRRWSVHAADALAMLASAMFSVEKERGPLTEKRPTRRL